MTPIFAAIPPVVVIGLVLLKRPAIPGMVAGTLSASAIAIFHGVSLGDAMGAIHYGYESTIATKLGEAAVADIPAILSEHGISGVAPELAHEV